MELLRNTICNAGKRNTIIKLMLAVFAILTVVGCGAGKQNDDDMSKALAGVWVDDAGDLIHFLPGESAYVLKMANGRIGRGNYTPSEGYLGFNRFIYDIEMQLDGSFKLRRNGSPADDSEESMDGFVFVTSPLTDVPEYDTSLLNGTWVSESGTTVTIDTETMEYGIHSESGAGSGTISNDGDGRGLYLFTDGASFVILNEDGTLSFESNDEDLAGEIFRQE